jgi:DNA polymerase-3 subunit epsilon
VSGWRDRALSLGWTRSEVDALAWDEEHHMPARWVGVEVTERFFTAKTVTHAVCHVRGSVIAGPPKVAGASERVTEEPAAALVEEPAVEPLKVALLDLETTGLRPCRVVEIGAWVCQLPSGRLGAGASRLVNPDQRIPQEAQRIHGITDRMVSPCPLFEVVWPRMCAWVDAQAPAYVVAHNADRFDRAVLEDECARLGLELPRWAWVDSLPWIKQLRPGLGSYALGSLARAASVLAGDHRVRGDVVALAGVLRWALGGRDPRLAAPRVVRWGDERAETMVAPAQQLALGVG